jgi:hypothetical protein
MRAIGLNLEVAPPPPDVGGGGSLVSHVCSMTDHDWSLRDARRGGGEGFGLSFDYR